MDYDEINRLIAAQLAAAVIAPRRDGFTGATILPTADSALATYSECVKKLRALSAKDPNSY